MPTHRCLDPQDPYAEREVRVAFEWVAGQPRLLTALDEQETDILPDLIEAQRDDLRREIVATPRSGFDGVRAATTRGPPATAC